MLMTLGAFLPRPKWKAADAHDAVRFPPYNQNRSSLMLMMCWEFLSIDPKRKPADAHDAGRFPSLDQNGKLLMLMMLGVFLSSHKMEAR